MIQRKTAYTFSSSLEFDAHPTVNVLGEVYAILFRLWTHTNTKIKTKDTGDDNDTNFGEKEVSSTKQKIDSLAKQDKRQYNTTPYNTTHVSSKQDKTRQTHYNRAKDMTTEHRNDKTRENKTSQDDA